MGNCNELCLDRILPVSGEANRQSCDPSVSLMLKPVLKVVSRVTTNCLLGSKDRHYEPSSSRQDVHGRRMSRKDEML